MNNPPNVPLITSILVFISTIFLFIGIFYYLDYRKKHSDLIGRVKKGGGKKKQKSSTGIPARFDNIKSGFMRIFGSLGNLSKPKDEEDISNMRRTLVKAGYRKENTLIIFLGIKSFLAFVLLLSFPLIKSLVTTAYSPTQTLLYSVLLALFGFYLPNIWLQAIIARRKDKILEGFPDALDLLVVCVEAGLGLDAAMNRVGEEMQFTNKPLSEEFKLLNMEMRAGKQRQSALRSMASRINLEDVSSLVTLLIQTDKFGTSVAQALRVHSDFMRIKRFQKAEEIAAKLPVKLLFPLILFIFPSLFVVILGPAAIQIFRVILPGMRGM